MNNLRVYRRIAGISQAKFAQLAGISQSEVSFYESGIKIPKLKYKRRFAKIFGLTVEELFPNERRCENEER